MKHSFFLLPWFRYNVAEFEQLCNPPNCDLVIMEVARDGIYMAIQFV
jgi:hypothetical protein